MKVKFVPQNVEFEILPNQSVMHVAQDHGIYIKSVCKGVPSCAECRVRLVEGEHNVLPPGSEELSLIGTGHFIDRRRLSCQLKCYGDITVDMTEQIGKENGTIVGRKKRLAIKDDRVEQAVVRRSEESPDLGGEESPEGEAPREPRPERPQRDNRPPRNNDRGPRPQQGARGPSRPGGEQQQQQRPQGPRPDRPPQGPRPPQQAGAQRPEGEAGPDGQPREGGGKRRRRRRGGKGGGGGGAPGGGPIGGPNSGGSAPSRPSGSSGT